MRSGKGKREKIMRGKVTWKKKGRKDGEERERRGKISIVFLDLEI